MGITVPDLNVPILKNTNAIIAFSQDEIKIQGQQFAFEKTGVVSMEGNVFTPVAEGDNTENVQVVDCFQGVFITNRYFAQTVDNLCEING